MDNKTRWSINFDLKHSKLSKYYKSNFRDAWNKVWKVMERSGYQSFNFEIILGSL